jgi:hypothetical protein
MPCFPVHISIAVGARFSASPEGWNYEVTREVLVI